MEIGPPLRIAVVVFDGAEELDFVGPYEVFGAWAAHFPEDGVEVVTVAPRPGPVVCAKGLEVIAERTWDDLGGCDVVVYPGGRGARAQVGDEAVRMAVRDMAASARIMASVCTGALVFADAGLLSGRPAITHWSATALLGEIDPSIEVREGARFVDDGDVVTAAGVSAGIDMALGLVARLHSPRRARQVAHAMEYDPQPPL